MADFRFPDAVSDVRFPGGGVDVEHPDASTDVRFPDAVTDTRFEGGYGSIDLSYANLGGTGDRQALLTITSDIPRNNGTWEQLFDGALSNSVRASGTQGSFIRLEWLDGPRGIDQLTLRQNNANQHITMEWYASNDAVAWTQVMSATRLGGATASVHDFDLYDGSSTYTFWELREVSDAWSFGTFMQEMEFRIGS